MYEGQPRRERLYIEEYLSGLDLVEWLERLAVNDKVATVLGSIPAASDTVESEGRQMKQCRVKYVKEKIFLNSPFKNIQGPSCRPQC
jgi:hypothetical protein